MPAKSVDLIEKLGLSPPAASGFFKRKFGGRNRYLGMCERNGALAQKLKELEGGYSPSVRLVMPEHVTSDGQLSKIRRRQSTVDHESD